MYNRSIGSCYKQKRQQHGHCPILRMSVNAASMIFHFPSWIIYVPIGCRHPFIWYWQPSLRKNTGACSLKHCKNEHQRSVNDLWFCKSENCRVIWSLLCITNVLAAFIGKRDCNTATAQFWEWASTERQQFVVCKYGNYTVIRWLICIHDVLATFIGKRVCDTVTAPFWELASTLCERVLASHLG